VSEGALASRFRPAWWCRNRHLQTLWGPLARRDRVPTRRERLETPDGDFLDLDWLEGPAGSPLVAVLHGLEGSSDSHYVSGFFRECRTRSWRAVALNFRSCSGELNRLPRFYHSGETGDLDFLVRVLIGREPDVRLGLVGVSLGGNVLLKWLGEQGDETPEAVRGGVAVSVPFDLFACARVMDRGLNRRLYTANFLRSMRRKVVEKARRYPAFVDVPRARRARTFAEYDRVVTAPLGGFADEQDYWVRASSGPYLPRIRRPALLINARDDPFVPPSTLPDGLDSKWILAEFTERGGHVGFVTGPPWRPSFWAEARAIEFLARVC
jgi:predicted alpha/beta-fold hydrolase